MANLIMAAVGFMGGAAVAAAVFALVASLGIIPRMAGKTSVASYFVPLENAVIYGGICGVVIALCDQIPIPLGSWFAVVYGISAGIFTGCLAVALAEVLNVFPVLFRRLKLKKGLTVLVTAFALGKTAGALYYFGVLFR